MVKITKMTILRILCPVGSSHDDSEKVSCQLKKFVHPASNRPAELNHFSPPNTVLAQVVESV